ncbi:hypothetical protein SAMN05421748_102399 [Paractinoplanes atraurantiacus]|uniref:Uncharacterized protein n=2 Tax=Paractinoplanes atraurantiacus TaxID=1036182 RepID=A0A285GTU4_9ACTN|nr:hypothetical protein SAMN05421748_102399 [Actinoplanes atraurantiacus]
MQVRAAVSAAFGDLQVILLRELAARLRAGDDQADRSLPVEATTDQLEAAVREAQAGLDKVRRNDPSSENP